MIANAEGKPDKLASLYSSHPVLLDFSLLLIVKKELADLTLTQETFSKYLEGGHNNWQYSGSDSGVMSGFTASIYKIAHLLHV